MEAEMKTQSKQAIEKLKQKAAELKFPLLVLAVGAVLVLLPFGKKQEKKSEKTETVIPVVQKEESFTEQTERRLSEILTGIEGAGKVRVMLTAAGSDITYYQTDSDISSEEQESTSKTVSQYKTVILSGSGEYDKAAVIKTEHPSFRGALILSQGADDPAVRLALVNAVSSLLGLGTDKISVVKMK